MNQRYRRSTYRQPTTYSTSCCPPSYETFAHTLLPLSASNSAGLGLSPCSTTMAMPQTQSPEPIHGLHYFQRPLWDPVSTLMLEPNASGASMERERSWEEAYDPFAQLQFTGPPASEQLLLPTPVSQSSECQRFPETSSRIPSLSLPSSQAGSYSSSSYPPSDRFEDSASLFSHSRLKMEGSLDWPGNPESELPTSRASMEPSECFIAPGAVYDARRVLRRSPEEGHLPLYSEPMLRKQTRRGSLVKRASHVPNEEPKSKTYKRRRTPRENANWLCEICDMPFERPYNLKSHLETHDPHREKPFKCEYEGCAREFVRKTDLVRHIQSVRILRVSHYLALTFHSGPCQGPRLGMFPL